MKAGLLQYRLQKRIKCGIYVLISKLTKAYVEKETTETGCPRRGTTKSTPKRQKKGIHKKARIYFSLAGAAGSYFTFFDQRKNK